MLLRHFLELREVGRAADRLTNFALEVEQIRLPGYVGSLSGLVVEVDLHNKGSAAKSGIWQQKKPSRVGMAGGVKCGSRTHDLRNHNPTL